MYVSYSRLNSSIFMEIKKLTKEQKETRKRILTISFERRISHIGSCLSAVDLIHAVYNVKGKDEIFILSNGHAGIAWYVILEKHGLLSEDELKNLHVHPDRNLKHQIHVSTGSLGQGLPIAVGMALANRKKNVYCSISDGETTEGSIWESLRLASELKLDNLKIILNANGWGAYNKIKISNLFARFQSFGVEILETDGHNLSGLEKALKTPVYRKPLLIFARTTVKQFPFLRDQDAHYYVMKDEDHSAAIVTLSK